jgi:hypothetical protein
LELSNPKRGIELGWVTRGTRLKRTFFILRFHPRSPWSLGSSGSSGSLGILGILRILGIENRKPKFFFSFPAGNNYQKKIIIILFFSSIRADSSHACIRTGQEGGEGRGGREGRSASARMQLMSAWTHKHIRADTMYPRGRKWRPHVCSGSAWKLECVRANGFLLPRTVKAFHK